MLSYDTVELHLQKQFQVDTLSFIHNRSTEGRLGGRSERDLGHKPLVELYKDVTTNNIQRKLLLVVPKLVRPTVVSKLTREVQ